MKKRTAAILKALDDYYGTEYYCPLNHENAWQLLVATILSAQCTDARVNLVTADLFCKYPDVRALAGADLKELEQDIHSTGFYHNKAKNLIACSRLLLEKHGGEVPRELEELIRLPGVGRKTANVIRGNIYHEPSIVVDTHVKRISQKLGLTKESDPVKIEFDLMKELPRDHWILYNIHLITLGREICKAPTPKCEECFLQGLCPDYAARSRSAAAGGGKRTEAVKGTGSRKRTEAAKGTGSKNRSEAAKGAEPDAAKALRPQRGKGQETNVCL